MGKTAWSGMWFFGVPSGEGDVPQGRDRTTQRGRYSNFLRAVAHIRLGTAQLSGPKLESGAGRCFLDCGGPSHPV